MKNLKRASIVLLNIALFTLSWRASWNSHRAPNMSAPEIFWFLIAVSSLTAGFMLLLFIIMYVISDGDGT